jgi:hypothetical protein
VLEDVLDEIYTISAADELFGVVIDSANLTVDADATARRRRQMEEAAQ